MSKLTGLLATLAVILPLAEASAEQRSLYLRRAREPVLVVSGAETDRLISPEAPPGENETDESSGVREERTEVIGNRRFSSAAPHIGGISSPPLSAVLYLATDNQPMEGCAGVFVDVYRVGPNAVGSEPVVVGSVTATLVPRNQGALTNPILVPLALNNTTWQLAPGDGLEMHVRVFNGCADGQRNVSLIYDAISQASRLVFDVVGDTGPFTDNCANVENPEQFDADSDGLGDACDTCPNDPTTADELDSDGDGVGDSCDNCALPNPNQLDADLDTVGDVCQVPPVPGACGPCPCDATVESLRCWVNQLHDNFTRAQARDVAPDLQRRRAPTMRALRRARRFVGVLTADTTGRLAPRRVGRDLTKVFRALKRFEKKERKARLGGKISQPMHDRLGVILAKAMNTIDRFVF